MTTSGILEETRADKRGKDADRIRHRTMENQQESCACPGCIGSREGLSVYCRKHRERYRRYGHPTLTLPTKGELKRLEAVVREWLTSEDHLCTPVLKASFKSTWGSAEKRLHKPASAAIGYFRLEGQSGLTAKSKASVLLAHYQHRAGLDLGDAMIRWMAVRLWAELRWQMPPGKAGVKKEMAYFVNTHAGRWVISRSGFSKTTNRKEIVDWKRNSITQELEPVHQRIERVTKLSAKKQAAPARAIGRELREAVEFALGKDWVSHWQLLQHAYEALGIELLT